MNKLQLAQAVQKEINSYAVGNPLVTTVLDGNAPVQQRQVVGWLEAEYEQLWTEQPWAWKMASGTVLTTVAGTADYACETVGQDAVEEFVPDTFKIRKVGQTVWTPLIWVDYRGWLDCFDVVADSLADQWPSHITQLPDKRLRLTPAPDAAYEVAAQYELPFTPLANDAAVPPWHPALHDVLVYRTARNFLEETSTGPMAARVLKKLAEREQTFINRYVP
jgi:hypothetical protein